MRCAETSRPCSRRVTSRAGLGGGDAKLFDRSEQGCVKCPLEAHGLPGEQLAMSSDDDEYLGYELTAQHAMPAR